MADFYRIPFRPRFTRCAPRQRPAPDNAAAVAVVQLVSPRGTCLCPACLRAALLAAGVGINGTAAARATSANLTNPTDLATIANPD